MVKINSPKNKTPSSFSYSRWKLKAMGRNNKRFQKACAVIAKEKDFDLLIGSRSLKGITHSHILNNNHFLSLIVTDFSKDHTQSISGLRTPHLSP